MPDTATTNARIDYQVFQQIVPEMGTGMAAISHALRKSGLEPDLIELLKVRISQLNGCAFCVQYHLNDARKLNVLAAKLDLLAAWREAAIYTDRETAALDWAEHVTFIANHHIDDEAYTRLTKQFNEREIAFLTTAIGQINFWNRVAAPLRFTPPIPSGS
jgi:AhpD family alkylhydroperoxidase